MKNIAKKSSDSESRTVYWIPPLSSETSGSSSQKATPKHIREWLISLPQDSLVSPSQSQESEKASQTKEICGRQLGTPYALYDQNTHSLRTSQVSLFQDTMDESSLTFTKSGTMRNGRCWELPISGHRIEEKGSGSGQNWRTPHASDGGQVERTTPGGGIRKLEDKVSQSIGRNTGQLNPDWVEWLMGWPVGWSSLDPIKDIIWLSWDVDPADMEVSQIFPTPRNRMTGGVHPNRSIDKFNNLESVISRSQWPTPSHGGSHSGGYISEWGGSGNKMRGKDLEAGIGPIPRVATRIKDRVARLKAIGNGQVPQVAATAWETLTNRA